MRMRKTTPPTRFNSRACMGRDGTSSLSYPDPYKFQHTRPHGARRNEATKSSSKTSSFNSRARVGRDRRGVCVRVPREVSIHAPMWGATQAIQKEPAQNQVSTHAPMRGRTKELYQQTLRFQFTRPRGARLLRCPTLSKSSIVSIHAPAWGATIAGHLYIMG